MNEQSPKGPPYISPSELSDRWQCSRSSVDRIARRASLTRVCLGEGRKGMVRNDRKEVEAYENERRVMCKLERRRSNRALFRDYPGDASPPG